MATALDDFELVGKPSDLSDFQVVPQPSTATVGKLPSAQDVSDFELATPESEKQDFLSGKTSANNGDLSQFLTKGDPNALSPFVGESTSLADPKEHGTSLAEMENPLKNTLPRPTRYRSDIEGPVSKVITGLTETAEDAIESAGSPLNALLLGGTGGLGKIGSRLMSLGFSASMAKDIPAHLEAINDATDTRDKAKAWSGLILSGLMTYAAGKHGIMGETPAATTPEARTAQTQAELQKLAPETAPNVEPRAVPNPEFLDGLHIARKTLLKDFNEKPPEVQKARQQQIDEIDEQLLAHDKDAVSESAARTAQPAPPTGQPEQPTEPEVQGSPPVQGGRSSLFSQALSEQVVAPVKQAAEAAQEIAPETAKAAEQIADTLAQKVSSSPVEPPASGEAPEPIAGAERTPAYEEAKKTTPDTSGAKEGFVDGQGNFISREEAAAKTGLPTDTEPGKLHSSDLPEAKGETPDIGTFKPEKMTQLMAQLGADEPVSETPPARKTLTKEETIAALQRELDSAREDDRTHDVTRLKKRIKELSTQSAPESERVVNDTSEAAAEPPKEAWQKTRDEVKDEGSSLTRHRSEVRSAVAEGKQVPLEVLEGFSGFKWADDARKKLYGDQISDTFLGKILKGLSDDPSKMMSDPLFIQSVGKPALRLAVRILQESINAGKLGHDAVADAINYLKTKIPDLNEDKAKEFLHQVFEKPAPEPIPEQRSVETPPESVSGDARPEPTATPEASGHVSAPDSGDKLTSTQHAATDAERAVRDVGEREQQGRQAFGDIWDKAKQEIDFSRSRAPELVDEINSKPRATTALEEAILLRHKVSVMNELDGHVQRALDESADPQERMASRVESARLMDELNEIDRATSLSGSETGRSLRFRQVLAAQDYSLVKMLQRKQLAKGDVWDSMSEDEKAKQTEQVKKISDRLADLEKQNAEHQTRLQEQQEQIKNQDADKAITRIQNEQTPADKYAQGLVDKIRQGLKSEADKARERIRARLGKAFAAVDPVVIYDAAIIGAEKLFSAGLDFAKWSNGMIKDLGEFIQPHLEEIWDKSKAINEDAVEKGAPKPLREKIKAKAATDADKRNAIVETIRSRKGENEAIGSQIQKLAENFVRNGITEREALVSAVHDAVKGALPEATPRDIRDAISGYGDFKELSKDETKAKLRDLKGQMQQVSKIEDITAEGKAKKTGVQRRIRTAEERRLLAEVNRVKKEYGIESDDPEALASALGAAKTRLRNRIEDLKTAIAKKEKLAPKGKKLVDDDETTQLRKDKDALQSEYDAAFGNPKPTAEQIAADKAQQAVDKASAALDRQQRINSGDIKPEVKEKAHPLSALEKELRDRTKDLKDAKRKADVARSPEEIAADKAQKGVDAAASALDKWDRYLKGETSIATGKTHKEALSNLEEELNSQVDAMKQAHRELQKTAKPNTEQQTKLKALEKSIADYEKKAADLRAGIERPKLGKKAGPDTEIVEKAKVARDAAKKVVDDLEKAKNPPKTPDEIALAAYKTRTQNRISELNDRLKRNDFSKAPKKELKMDAEGSRLKTEVARAKLNFDREVYRDKQANRATWEKAMDLVPKVSRFSILSSPAIVGKLAGAFLWNSAIAPFQELAGSALSVIPAVGKLAEMSPREGGFNMKAEAKALTGAFTKGMKDAWTAAKKGDTDLDVLYGKPRVQEQGWAEFPARMHAALHAPALRAEFERSFEKRATYYGAQGVDISSEPVQMRIGTEAYADALRAVFREPNQAVQGVNAALARWGQPTKETGRPSIGLKSLQTTVETLLPVRNVPANIVSQALDYAIGSVSGSIKLRNALKSGLETIKPEERDMIMRQLKRGSVGAALMALGYFGSKSVGGFYQRGQKQSDEDVKPGQMRFFGVNIPTSLLHHPALEAVQIGSTINRVADSRLHKKDLEKQGVSAGVFAAGLGLVEGVPGVREMADFSKFLNPTERGKFINELVKSRVDPAVIQSIAEAGDRQGGAQWWKAGTPTTKRDPQDLKDTLKTGIPGLREQVPEKARRFSIRRQR